jgi:hypothetical protein
MWVGLKIFENIETLTPRLYFSGKAKAWIFIRLFLSFARPSMFWPTLKSVVSLKIFRYLYIRTYIYINMHLCIYIYVCFGQKCSKMYVLFFHHMYIDIYMWVELKMFENIETLTPRLYFSGKAKAWIFIRLFLPIARHLKMGRNSALICICIFNRMWPMSPSTTQWQIFDGTTTPRITPEKNGYCLRINILWWL